MVRPLACCSTVHAECFLGLWPIGEHSETPLILVPKIWRLTSYTAVSLEEKASREVQYFFDLRLQNGHQ